MALAVIPRAVLIVLTLLVVLALAASAYVVGSPDPRPLPPPTGPARNGLIAFASSGDIWVMDQHGDHRRQLTSGSDLDSVADWSPDGTWLAYWSQAAESADGLEGVSINWRAYPSR
jgi:hypothetical protein